MYDDFRRLRKLRSCRSNVAPGDENNISLPALFLHAPRCTRSCRENKIKDNPEAVRGRRQ